MKKEFEIRGVKYQARKINAFKQFHIVRRLAPIMSELLPAMGNISKFMKQNSELTESSKFDEMAKIAAPVLDGLAKLSDEDSNKVLLGLLAAVEVQQGAGNWAPLASDDRLMFDNLELPEMLQCAGQDFAFNMAGFFAVLPQVSPGKGE